MNRCLFILALLVPFTRAAALDDAGKSAVAFLREATTMQRDGREGRVLAALRDLRDPALEPFFAQLATSPQVPLQLHGSLGLAEVSRENRLELARLAEIAQPAAQAQLVTAALDHGLLTDEDAKQLLAWDGLDTSVKLLVALRRFNQPDFSATGLLHEAAQSGDIGRRSLAGLMLHQLGDAAGAAILTEVNASTHEKRDAARVMLLQTALKHGFDRIGPWAHAVATETETNESLRMLALRTAIRFGERRAVERWKAEYAGTADPSARMRLALTALNVAPWSPPELFDPLRASDDPVLRQIGLTGGAIAAAGPKGGNVAEEVVALLLLHHPYTNAWAIEYARDWATPEDAQLICLGLLKAFEEGPRNTRQRRVDETIGAAKLLHERFPDLAAAVLGPMMTDPDTGPLTRQAILLGLLQSEADATAIAQGLPGMPDAELSSLALLLRATSRTKLTPAEVADLGLLARGGGMLRDEFRAQAAWAYLARTGQAKEAVGQLVR